MRVEDASVTGHGEDPGMDRGNGARSTETVGRRQRYERKAMPRGRGDEREFETVEGV